MKAPFMIASVVVLFAAAGVARAQESKIQLKEGPGRDKVNACLACHSLDGNPGVGPSFKGMWGSTAQMVDGTTRKLDSAFVREKILHPTQNLIKGYDPVMPELPVSDEEIKLIEQYLEGLK